MLEMENMPSKRYEANVQALRDMLFGRYSRRNVRGQNREGGRLDNVDYEAIKQNGAFAIQELKEKYAGAL